jgi:hypothetical protein
MVIFTKRHFNAFAKIVKEINHRETKLKVNQTLVAMFKADNPRFDIKKWNNAIGE